MKNAGTSVVFAAILTCLGCGDNEIPKEVVEATKPPNKDRAASEAPPLTPSNEKFAEIPTPTGAKHTSMLDGRFRYLIQASPGETIGYFKNYVLPASVELEGAATLLRDAVAKQGAKNSKVDLVIRPSTPGWTQVEITPETKPVATGQRNESEVVKAAKQAFEHAQ